MSDKEMTIWEGARAPQLTDVSSLGNIISRLDTDVERRRRYAKSDFLTPPVRVVQSLPRHTNPGGLRIERAILRRYPPARGRAG